MNEKSSSQKSHSSLIAAARANDAAAIQRLLTAGDSAFEVDGQGWTALMHAADAGSVAAAELLAKQLFRFDVDAGEFGSPALSMARDRGHIAVARQVAMNMPWICPLCFHDCRDKGCSHYVCIAPDEYEMSELARQGARLESMVEELQDDAAELLADAPAAVRATVEQIQKAEWTYWTKGKNLVRKHTGTDGDSWTEWYHRAPSFRQQLEQEFAATEHWLEENSSN